MSLNDKLTLPVVRSEWIALCY